MHYETLKQVIDFGLLIEEDRQEQYYKNWAKVSMKELQAQYGDLNKFLEYLAEYTPEEY